MAPLQTIVPFSPFSPSGEWECCACRSRDYMYRTQCVPPCSHTACDGCTIFDRRGEAVVPSRRIPVNWACAGAAHYHGGGGGPEVVVLHSVAELLVAAGAGDGKDEVLCWCGGPAFDPAAVYDHWGLLMGDEIVAAEAGVLDFGIVLRGGPPATIFNLADAAGRRAAAAFLRHHPGVEAWEPIVRRLAIYRAVEVAAAKETASVKTCGSPAGSSSPAPPDAGLPTPPSGEERLVARVTRKKPTTPATPPPREEVPAAKGTKTRKRRRDEAGEEAGPAPSLAARVTRPRLEKPRGAKNGRQGKKRKGKA
ncbi:hypothetical protein MAPG_11588 [Magnaporthiopsis poae ATCC 64411]|uniref:Uncharacterized protein n=1 Tax=Magnaporthiopsis poae (strain ATCC 64411 / 73-15) TaxID=644358 RepID=A0A0C4EFN6_MAGP6|nr:hypothetical protein MAPG_11588 [Magnaporthiopsis poae ATCC 64411]